MLRVGRTREQEGSTVGATRSLGRRDSEGRYGNGRCPEPRSERTTRRPAKKARKKPAPKHSTSSRASSKPSASKQSTGKKSRLKRSSLGLLRKVSKVTKVMGAIVMGAATGAMQGAVAAGTQATGSSPEKGQKRGALRGTGQSSTTASERQTKVGGAG